MVNGLEHKSKRTSEEYYKHLYAYIYLNKDKKIILENMSEGFAYYIFRHKGLTDQDAFMVRNVYEILITGVKLNYHNIKEYDLNLKEYDNDKGYVVGYKVKMTNTYQLEESEIITIMNEMIKVAYNTYRDIIDGTLEDFTVNEYESIEHILSNIKFLGRTKTISKANEHMLMQEVDDLKIKILDKIDKSGHKIKWNILKRTLENL